MNSEKKLVLVVDDNVDAADMTADLLRMHGLEVEVAYGGREALEAAHAQVPDVIFLDVGMPVIDGCDVARALRREQAFSDVKIIALTAWGDVASRQRTRDAGFDFHVTKPASMATLVELAR